MQPHDSNDQRPAQVDTDGRRDTERRAIPDTRGVVCPQVPDMDNRTVCLSAKLIGSGKAAG